MRQIIFATLLMLVLAGTNVACNTIHGFGQDVQREGEKTQDAADAVKKKLSCPCRIWPEISVEELPFARLLASRHFLDGVDSSTPAGKSSRDFRHNPFNASCLHLRLFFFSHF